MPRCCVVSGAAPLGGQGRVGGVRRLEETQFRTCPPHTPQHTGHCRHGCTHQGSSRYRIPLASRSSIAPRIALRLWGGEGGNLPCCRGSVGCRVMGTHWGTPGCPARASGHPGSGLCSSWCRALLDAEGHAACSPWGCLRRYNDGTSRAAGGSMWCLLQSALQPVSVGVKQPSLPRPHQ